MDTLLHRPSRAGGMSFAEDFDAEAPVETVEPSAEPEVIEPHFTAEDIDVARTVAWEEGRRAGAAEVSAGQSALVAQSVAAIRTALIETREEAAALARDTAETIARVLIESMAAMLPAFCADHGEGEVRAVAQAVLPGLLREPSLVIRVHPRLLGAVREEMSRLDPDLSTRVSLVPTDAMAPGDIRINWQDGAAQRDTGTLWRSVSDILCGTGLLRPTPAERELAHVG